jgi:dCMP deaminase
MISSGTSGSSRIRPTVDEYFLAIARVVASRGTCSRRQVGCVLVDGDRHIISTGYNGVAAGAPHCTDRACPGAGLSSGTGLNKCEAIHAEINALIHCAEIRRIETCYVTVSPCVSCVKALLSTQCRRVVATSAYSPLHDDARKMWVEAGRSWIVVEAEKPLSAESKLTTARAFSLGSPRSCLICGEDHGGLPCPELSPTS